MTQTGNGALNAQDIELLRKMPIFLLNEPDIHGRTILYFDESRVFNTNNNINNNNNNNNNGSNNNNGEFNGSGGGDSNNGLHSNSNNVVFDRIGFVRVIFYFLSVVLEDDSTQKKGIVVVTNTKVMYNTHRAYMHAYMSLCMLWVT